MAERSATMWYTLAVNQPRQEGILLETPVPMILDSFCIPQAQPAGMCTFLLSDLDLIDLIYSPKSVPLSHANLLRTTTNIVETYKLTSSDRSYLVMPLFHVHGLMCALLSSLRAQSSVVIPLKFSASTFWKDFAGFRCTWYTAVPTIHTILLSSPIPSPLPKIRFIRSCSAALPPVTFHKLEKTFKAPVLEAYAMTEAAHQMTSNVYGEPGVPGSVGKGVGVEVSIRDDDGNALPQGQKGEVCCRGPNVTKGYWNNEKANKESFWEGRWFRFVQVQSLHKDSNAFHLQNR